MCSFYVEIDFNKFNNEITEFKQKYGLPIKANLDVKLIVNSELDVQDNMYTEKDNSILSLSMDLNQQVFSISKNFEPSMSNQRFAERSDAKEINVVLLIIGIIILGISGIGILNLIRKIVSQDYKSDYDIALKRILKNYGDIVAEVITPTETEGMKVIDVKNFDQLLDIEEEIKMPILFYETVKGEVGEFTIYNDNIVYRYVLGYKKDI